MTDGLFQSILFKLVTESTADFVSFHCVGSSTPME